VNIKSVKQQDYNLVIGKAINIYSLCRGRSTETFRQSRFRIFGQKPDAVNRRKIFYIGKNKI